MKSKTTKIFMLFVCFALLATSIACGSRLMMPATTAGEITGDKALVTFVRAKAFGGGSEFIIWDSEEFVGTLVGGQYIQHEAPAGEHMFIVHAQGWSYIKANLEGGKRYYVVINTAPGFTRVSAIPVPITKAQTKYGQADIDNWMANLQPVEPDPQTSPGWVEKRLPQVKKAVENGQKPETKFQVINPEDNWN